MLAVVPSLRVFAILLCRNVDRADDLVQETLLRALTHIDSLRAGTSLPAWLFTILRNVFRSEYRKRRREVEDTDGSYAETLTTQPEQTSHLDFQDFLTALDKLPVNQREALILVGASGCSYGESAEICDCAVNTIKSRVRRARIRLAQSLSIECPRDMRIGRHQCSHEGSKGRKKHSNPVETRPKNGQGYPSATRLNRLHRAQCPSGPEDEGSGCRS